jgi:hypothetical protein
MSGSDKLAPHLTLHQVEKIFDEADTDRSGLLDIVEFIRCIEKVLDQGFHEQLQTQGAWLQKSLTWFKELCEKDVIRKMMLILVILEIWLFSYYSLWSQEAILDALLGVATVIHLLEVLIKIMAYGAGEYWFYSRSTSYVVKASERAEKEFAHRWDVATLAVTAILLAIVFPSAQARSDVYRFTLSIPLVRIFSLVKRTRKLIFTLYQVLPSFLSLFALLLLTMYIYGIYGMLLFSQKFDTILQDRAPDAHFDSLGGSMLALFQLFVGTHWQQVMYASIMATSWSVTWYFVTYVVIVTLLFSNLFVGVILAIFESVKDHGAFAQAKSR